MSCSYHEMYLIQAPSFIFSGDTGFSYYTRSSALIIGTWNSFWQLPYMLLLCTPYRMWMWASQPCHRLAFYYKRFVLCYYLKLTYKNQLLLFLNKPFLITVLIEQKKIYCVFCWKCIFQWGDSLGICWLSCCLLLEKMDFFVALPLLFGGSFDKFSGIFWTIGTRKMNGETKWPEMGSPFYGKWKDHSMKTTKAIEAPPERNRNKSFLHAHP